MTSVVLALELLVLTGNGCQPGSVQPCVNHECAEAQRVCSSDGTWGACACPKYQCEPGIVRTCNLRDCALPIQECINGGVWGPCACGCNDGNVCTTDYMEDLQTCVHGPFVEDDGNPCTIDRCDLFLGHTHEPAEPGTPCALGDLCVGDCTGTCDEAAVCVPATVPPDVDDGNPCTTDTYDALADVVLHTPVPAGTSCADANLCDGEETCDNGAVCTSGTPPPVDDWNPCTEDVCDPVIGATLHHAVVTGTSCSDSDVCNGAEVCDGNATCVAGVAPAIGDGNPCTADACDPVLGVAHPPVAAGTPCPDGSACNGDETCDATASCVPGAPPLLDDSDPCTVDTCDAVAGVVHTPIESCTDVPDPAETATALSGSSVTSFADAVSFLYSAPTPVQLDVDPSVFDLTRLAVLRGRVLSADGAPLGSVAVDVVDHPEFGRTYTRPDGWFDLAVNGGGRLTVTYRRDGYLSSQRATTVPWQDHAVLPDVVLLAHDPKVTPVALNAAASQIAQGSVVTDSAGTRQLTLYMPAGTRAGMVLPSGATLPLATASVRVTEYTANRLGTIAMPGELPSTSGYTYAVELALDEATAVGATDVQFDQPVALYVDNFLRFPVGGIVPTGFYDRAAAAWVPSENGRVVKVLGAEAGLATLDVDGAGVAADTARLLALGVSDDERRQLATLYTSGKELWRVRVTHFTPWDCNWPVGCTTSCTPPDAPEPPPPDPDPCSDTQPGSKIECQAQALGERVAITGTNFALHYQSDRTPGHRAERTLNLPLASSTVPLSVRRVDVTVSVAGRTFPQSFAPPFAPALTYTFEWDGRDPYGRPLVGKAEATWDIGYVYDTSYLAPADMSRSFAALSDSGIRLATSGAPGEPVTLIQSSRAWIGTWDARTATLGGWTIGIHHSYDPRSATLYLGDGTRRSARAVSQVIDTVVGGGTLSGEGIPATRTRASAYGLAVGPTGELYVTSGYTVRRVDRNGIIRTIAGNGQMYCDDAGDEGPAVTACIGVPRDVEVRSDGTVFIAGTYYDNAGGRHHRVRTVTPDGIIRTFAGTDEGFAGDGGLATAAKLNAAYSVALAPDGSVYILDQSRIRKVDPAGVITTIAGDGGYFASGDDGPAKKARFYHDGKIAIGPDGSIYLAPSVDRVIRRITPDGIIKRFAGGGSGAVGDGGPATQAVFQGYLYGLAVAPDGSVYVGETGTIWDDFSRVRRIGPDGIIRTVAGQGRGGSGGDGGPATAALFKSPYDVTVATDGTLYLSDYVNGRVRRVRMATLADNAIGQLAAGAELIVPSGDGKDAFVFDREGRHLRTVDALTGTVLFRFAYDANGAISSITDRNALVTRIERDVNGAPAAIVAPYGQRTALSVDADGYLCEITAPGNEVISLEYFEGGLLKTFIDARRNAHTFAYDALGRLERDANPAGGVKTLARTESVSGYGLELTSAFDASSALRWAYEVERLGAGGERRVNTRPDGGQEVIAIGTNGVNTSVAPDGTSTTTRASADPRFGMMAPNVSSTTTLPTGLTTTLSVARSVTLGDASNPLSVLTMTEQVTLDGDTEVTAWDARTLRRTVTSPAGRRSVFQYDTQGRIAAVEPPGYPGVLRTDIAYDAFGRVASISRGDRVSTVQYDTLGRPAILLDPAGAESSYEYDPAGRVTRAVLPGGRTVALTRDGNGNVTRISPPGRPSTDLSFDPADRLEAYSPPPVAGASNPTSFTYSLDGSFVASLLPDGSSALYAYESVGPGFTSGRVKSISTSRGATLFTYDAAGRLSTALAPEDQLVEFEYDGSLAIAETSTGTVNGRVAFNYGPALRITGVSVEGVLVERAYDADGLLTRAGQLLLTRDASTGWTTEASVGSVSTSYTYDAFGDVRSASTSGAGNPLFSYAVGRDAAGRITSRSEVVGGAAVNYSYEYDAAGRLARVTRNGAADREYAYDANGNRLSGPGGSYGTYDDQDRLLSYGGVTFSYGANGDLRTRSESGGTSWFSYDVLGNLIAVALPDGAVVEYVVDGLNRRVGKKVGGTFVEGFLYESQLRPAAWLDEAGRVKAHFVYGTRRNVPEYMVTNAGTYRIVADHLGSPRLVVNTTSGAVVQRLEYDEWGNVTMDTAPGTQPFGYAGGLWDRTTGLLRFGARDYDASTGRWTSKDPLRFEGGTLNLYEYALGDPINKQDPDGQFLPIIIVLGGGLVPVLEATGAVLLTVWTANTLYDLVSQARAEPSDRCERKRTPCYLIGSGGKGPKPGSLQRCNYLCEPPGGAPFQIEEHHETCPEVVYQ